MTSAGDGSFLQDALACVAGVEREAESARTVLQHVRTMLEQARVSILLIRRGAGLGDDLENRDAALRCLDSVLGPLEGGTQGTVAEHPAEEPMTSRSVSEAILGLQVAPPKEPIRLMPRGFGPPATPTPSTMPEIDYEMLRTAPGMRVVCRECSQGAVVIKEVDGSLWSLCPHCSADVRLGQDPDHVVEL